MRNLPASWRTVLLFLLIEFPFVPLLAIGWSQLLFINLGTMLTAVVLFNVLRQCAIAVQLGSMMGPVDDWRDADDPTLLTTSTALLRLPANLAIGQATGWAALYSVLTAYVWFWRADVAPIGYQELVAVGLFVLAISCGALVFSFAVGNLLIRPEREAISHTMIARGVESPFERVSLGARFNAILLAYVIVPMSVIASGGWANNTASNRNATISELTTAAWRDGHRIERGLEPLSGHVVTTDALPSTALAEAVGLSEFDDYHVMLDRRLAHVQVGVPIGDDRWVLVEAPVSNVGTFPLMFLVLGTAVLLWGMITSVIVTRSLIQPLVGLETTMRRFVDVGDIQEQAPLPVMRHDEIGVLTRCYNDLVASFRALTEAAQKLASGQLAVTLEQRGDLHDAFRGMVDQLAAIVVEIRTTALDVSSTTAEIHAATQEQEAAAQRSSAGVGAVRVTVASLANSARDISTMANEVRNNAEHTLATTDAMAIQIHELSQQASRITSLLGVIGEIADRSDLLALNGSLEAARVGEAGRGFALLAEEMRRLAERVTRTVADVRVLVAEIHAANSASVAATHESRELATATARAAQQIVTITQRQSDDTIEATKIVDTMADLVVANSVATTQTRAAAEGLHGRANALNRVIQRFELRKRTGAYDRSSA